MEESPALDEFHREHGDVADLLVVAVQDAESDVVGFMEENGYDFPIMLDPEGSLAGQYRIQGVPTLIVIDSEGNVDRQLVGVKPSVDDLVQLAEEAG